MKLIRVKLSMDGMCSNLNRLLNVCDYAKGWAEVVPWWPRSLYGNWRDFFRVRKSSHGQFDEDIDVRESRWMKEVNLTSRWFKTLSGYMILADPKDRQRAEELAWVNILPRKYINQMVKQALEYLPQPAVGLHLRSHSFGHAGAPQLNRLLGFGNPPYEAYFSAIDGLDSHLFIWLATDSQAVVDRMKERYGSRVRLLSICVNQKGEPHINGGYPPIIKGTDILTDVFLLAKCKYFIHGVSNVSNFILCWNSKLPHTNIYGELIKQEKNDGVRLPGRVEE